MEEARRSSVSETHESEDKSLGRIQTLGSLRLRHEETNEVILIPAPSNDPADPLNWSQAYKYYITGLVCFTMFVGGYLFAAPAVQIVILAMEFGDGDPRDMTTSISAVSYFISACNLSQGTGNIIWMPIVNKYGRRPIYIVSWALCLGFSFWAVLAKSYASELASRVLLGFACGASECLAPLTLAEIFFLHERGKMMGFVIFSLAGGTSLGLILGGLITINLSWQYIYWVMIPFIGISLLLIILTFPETNFKRDPNLQRAVVTFKSRRAEHIERVTVDTKSDSGNSRIETASKNPTTTFWRSIQVFHGTYTEESVPKMMIRPLLGLALPPILFAALIMGINIGFLVIVSSNQPVAFAAIYQFQPYQCALCWISGMIGALLGIFFGGKLSDAVADHITQRRDGLREPEMRLPVLIVPGIFGPLALILYGFGIHYQWHWFVPTLGIGFLLFAVVVAATTSTAYTVDSYRPIAGETVVTKMVFKAVFGFVLSFHATGWIDRMGYRDAFGAMAGIYVFIFLFTIPVYMWGERFVGHPFNGESCTISTGTKTVRLGSEMLNKLNHGECCFDSVPIEVADNEKRGEYYPGIILACGRLCWTSFVMSSLETFVI